MGVSYNFRYIILSQEFFCFTFLYIHIIFHDNFGCSISSELLWKLPAIGRDRQALSKY